MKRILLQILVFTLPLSIFGQSVYEIQGQQASSPYSGQSVTTQGLVTAVFPGSYFIQDGDSAWCGVYVYDSAHNPKVGDSISFSANVSEYYDLTELKDLSNFSILSSDNPLPTPIVLSTLAANEEQWEGVYIQVRSAVCTNPALGYGEWEVNDGSGALVVDNMGIEYTATKDVAYEVVGPLNYSYSQYKIAPSSEADIVMDLSLFMTQNPEANHIDYTSFDLEFETNDSSLAVVEYGLTAACNDSVVKSTISDRHHSINLNHLEAGEFYYAKIYAVNASADTTPVFQGIFATRSLSSGIINVSFVNPIAVNTPNTIVDTLEHYIGLAHHTLDVAIYDLTNHATASDSTNYRLIDAINQAYDRGVVIRVITDDEVANAALDSLNVSIPVLKGNNDGIMHHKFLVIDKHSVDSAWVVAGSTNWTYNNLMMDFNNLIAIQDQSIAKAYTMEFEEMWGSSTSQPDVSNARFGAYKQDNTPHHFMVGNSPVKLYFSPSDNTESYIEEAMDSAQNSINFVVMAFTRANLYSVINEANSRGLKTRGVIDYVEYSESNFNMMVAAGVDVINFANPNGLGWPDNATCHHKFAVIDVEGTKPLTITGTHNWSASANSKNDENTLFIYNKEIAERYVAELERIRAYVSGASGLEELLNEESYFSMAPNPTQGLFELKNIDSCVTDLFIYNVNGKLILHRPVEASSCSIEIQKKGLYLVRLTGSAGDQVKRLLVR